MECLFIKCSSCKKELHKDEFIGKWGKTTKTCKKCREKATKRIYDGYTPKKVRKQYSRKDSLYDGSNYIDWITQNKKEREKY